MSKALTLRVFLFAFVCSHVALALRTYSHSIHSEGAEETRGDKDLPWIETLSWSPRAFLYHNFLSEEEADHIVKEAKPLMRRSTVIGLHGQDVEDPIRTSYGTFLPRLKDPIVTKIEERVAVWTRINMTHQEDMQVLRYGQGQKYGAHHDTLVEESRRMATVLLYLSDVSSGGETAFTGKSVWADESLPARLGPFSPCAQGHVAAKPKKGDALLFFSLLPDGETDNAAMHTGCPVIDGVKWTGTIWIHTNPFRLEGLGKDIPVPRFPEQCEDFHQSCAEWAEKGECDKNAKFMKGDAFHLGECRLSCGECEQCAPGDRGCQSRNRVKAGYLSLEEIDRE